MKKLALIIGFLIFIYLVGLVVAHAHCDIFSTTLEIKNYTGVCKFLATIY